MTEAQIRRIVQQEIDRNNKATRFNLSPVTNHEHDGIDSPRIKGNNIIPSCSVVGSVTFATVGQTYTLNLNSSFTPQRVVAHSIVYNTSGEIYRGFFYGEAQLTPSFYFQTSSSTSVVTGNKQYPFPTELFDGSIATVPAQSSSGLLISRTTDSNVFANQSEDHILSAYVSTSDSGIRARATVVGFNRDSIQVYVPYLTTDWAIDMCFIVS